MKHGGWNLEIGCDDGIVVLRWNGKGNRLNFDKSNLLSESKITSLPEQPLSALLYLNLFQVYKHQNGRFLLPFFIVFVVINRYRFLTIAESDETRCHFV